MSVLRFDAGSLRRPEYLADGRVKLDGVLSRAGVFEYRMPGGAVRREYRPPDEVFRADALASFDDVPFTDDHPPEMVTAANHRQYSVGTVRDPRRDGDHAVGRIIVNDAATVAKIKAGKVALSCGYEVDLQETPGVTPEGERYDAIQTNIRGNHVALVEVGRAGPAARLRMDCATMVGEFPTRTDISKDEPQMTLEQALAELAKSNKEAGAAAARADKAEADLKAAAAAHAAALATATAERDAEKLRADKAEAARNDAAAGEAERVRARVALEAAAAGVLKDTKLASMSEREIKVAVIKKLDGADVAADAHDEYVRARFDIAMERAGKADAALAEVRTVAAGGRNDAAPAEFDERAARRKMEQESAERPWKQFNDKGSK